MSSCRLQERVVLASPVEGKGVGGYVPMMTMQSAKETFVGVDVGYERTVEPTPVTLASVAPSLSKPALQATVVPVMPSSLQRRRVQAPLACRFGLEEMIEATGLSARSRQTRLGSTGPRIVAARFTSELEREL